MTRKKKQTVITGFFTESTLCQNQNCNHMALEHESFYKIHGPASLPQVILWNCKVCTCRKFIR